MSAPQAPRYQTRAEVDFVVVGSGAAGGILAKELSEAGFSVVVLEQGPYTRAQDFKHDELAHWFNNEMLGSPEEFPTTFRKSEAEEAEVQAFPPAILYRRGVGGSSVHFTANFWRFHEIDFIERSRWGPIAGTGFADWPITYAELEPYYTKVDWEIGVSGEPGPFDPPRSRPYPVPPLPIKSSGVLLERGARKLGWKPFPAPMAILSQPHDGRLACVHCGFCMLHGCEVGAKSSTLATMIPKAEATGRCEIRAECTVHRLETNAAGRVTDVVYWDGDGREQAQRARAVILSANGAETTRILLLSKSTSFPDGLANSSGKVGKYLMLNGQSFAYGTFEHPCNEYKSVQVTRILHDFYDADPKRGFYGGGGIDARFSLLPIGFAAWWTPPKMRSWGSGYKRWLAHAFTRTIEVNTHTTSLPVETNSISLDAKVKDKWGRPALRMTYRDHPDDLKTMGFLQKRALELLDAADAEKTWSYPVAETNVGVHLLGTSRMGNDPRDSVVDRFHRAHDVRNLFICDGSSLVTSGRGQPTMTIMALAFRAAQHIAQFAKAGEI
ncbi:MAG: GMC family oxidoreductase [Longimicrobiales bacterium]